MITRVSIRNYRSFGVEVGEKPHVVDFTRLTLIVGDNSSGKSNILRALEFATVATVDGMSDADFFIKKGPRSPRKTRSIVVEVFYQTLGQDRSLKCTARKLRDGGYEKVFSTGGKQLGKVSSNSPAPPKLDKTLSHCSVFRAPTVREVRYLDEAVDLLPTATRSLVKGKRNEFNKVLAQKLVGICRELAGAFGVEGVTANPSLNLDELMHIVRLGYRAKDTVSLPVENLGQGLLSKAIIRLSQMRGEGRAVCIEEPEIHVHPSGVKDLAAMFKTWISEKGRQLIVTTHSVELVNCADFQSMVVVCKEDGKSRVQPVLLSGAATLRGGQKFIEATVLRKCQRGDIFLSKYILLVEGPYDRMVLEHLEDTGMLSLAARDVRVVEMGGKEEFEKYYHLLRGLTKPFAALVDSDAFATRQDAQNPTSLVVDGPVTRTIKADTALASVTWPDSSVFMPKAAPAKRREVTKLAGATSPSRFVVVTHGHHDMRDYVSECWSSLTVDQRLEAYKQMGGPAPQPTQAEADRYASKGINQKDFAMLRVVEAIPPRALGVLTRTLNGALSKLGVS